MTEAEKFVTTLAMQDRFVCSDGSSEQLKNAYAFINALVEEAWKIREKLL